MSRELSPRLTLLTASYVLLGSCLNVTALRQHLLARAVKLFWQRAQREPELVYVVTLGGMRVLYKLKSSARPSSVALYRLLIHATLDLGDASAGTAVNGWASRAACFDACVRSIYRPWAYGERGTGCSSVLSARQRQVVIPKEPPL